MTTETIVVVSRIRNFIIDHFPLANKAAMITDDNSLLDSGIIDSLGIMDVILFIEKEFEIIVSDDDLLPGNFETINRMAVFVQTKRNCQSNL
jgi:acyl carrier protein